jgi:hypothetical protein
MQRVGGGLLGGQLRGSNGERKEQGSKSCGQTVKTHD